jgi:hypothetical protein
MLSGIKTGKRKRKLENQSSSSEATENKVSTSSLVSNSTTTTSSNSANYNAAQELRRMLASSSSSSSQTKETATSYSTTAPTVNSKVNEPIHLPSESQGHRVYNAINSLSSESNVEQEGTTSVVLYTSKNPNSQPIFQKEDFKRGARKGKLKSNESFFHADKDKSIQDLVQEEKQNELLVRGGMDEIYARNVARLGSRYKATEFKSMAGSSAGADEEDMAGDGGIDMTIFSSNQRRLTEAAKHNREMSKQIALINKEQKVTSLCWWWMESSSFQKHRLLSLGDYVSLVYVPSHLALVESQCYLVPIKVSFKVSRVCCPLSSSSCHCLVFLVSTNIIYLSTLHSALGFFCILRG